METVTDTTRNKVCGCGCGQFTPIVKRSRPQRGVLAGYPANFIKGHKLRKYPFPYREENGPLDTPCWIWLRLTDRGYGIISVKGKSRRAHIVNYESKYGKVPEGKELDHICRIRACGNPDHVEPVSHTENVRRSATAKINPSIANQIREMRTSGKTLKEISNCFSIHIATVHNVISGATWNSR